ncbi:electron transport complex subunit RsxC [Candidatus Halobeggiatoa sp. HSG11]|nr:electron transport complex subunit RsxC [Candidatus Halobeggiatoa sp. HSG11]
MQFFRRKTFSHGVHPPGHKDDTNIKSIRRMAFAPKMIVPLAQHFGAPAAPIVYAGQNVVRGEPIAKANGFMSVPHHAPATGTIDSIELMSTARGPKTESIILKVTPGASQNVLYGIPHNIDDLTQEEIINAIQDTGVIGLGGAGFPSHAKLTVPKEHKVDTVLVNGCECEPYLTNDHRIMLERIDELITGIRIVLKALGAEQAIIGIEDNKLDAVKAIQEKLPPQGPISIKVLKTKYPQGAEKMLIKSVLNREVPSGNYPSSVGVGVYNVGTLSQLGTLLPQRQGLIERVVTITGPGVKKPGNYMIALGTPLRFVMKQVGYTGSVRHLILGGPMMGTSVASLDVPITKTVSAVLVLTKEEEAEQVPEKIYPCIKCGACVKACPVHLNPTQLVLLASKRRYEDMQEKFHLNDCFECGCCSYVCPAGIPLVQYFRIAKAINREKNLS